MKVVAARIYLIKIGALHPVLVELITDEGIVGVGEAAGAGRDSTGGGSVGGPTAAAVTAAVGMAAWHVGGLLEVDGSGQSSAAARRGRSPRACSGAM